MKSVEVSEVSVREELHYTLTSHAHGQKDAITLNELNESQGVKPSFIIEITNLIATTFKVDWSEWWFPLPAPTASTGNHRVIFLCYYFF